SLSIDLTPPGLSIFPSTTLFRSEGWRISLQVIHTDDQDVALAGWLRPGSCLIFLFLRLSIFRQSSGLAARMRPGLLLPGQRGRRSEEHTSELQSRENLVCRLLLV